MRQIQVTAAEAIAATLRLGHVIQPTATSAAARQRRSSEASGVPGQENVHAVLVGSGLVPEQAADHRRLEVAGQLHSRSTRGSVHRLLRILIASPDH